MLSSLIMLGLTARIGSHHVTLPSDIAFPETGQELVKEYDDVDAGLRFTQAIPSWNVDRPQVAAVKVELRAHTETGLSKWFVLADWAYDAKLQPRVSVTGQKDPDGNVLTDTLVLAKPSEKIDLRVTLKNLGAGDKPQLKLLSLAFSNKDVETPDEAKPSPAWGKLIDVPQRAQGNYPNGGVLCSATSVSMLLWHWSNELHRPELNKDVPEVESGVWDSVYKGAGNWPFNTAFAGSFPGMRGYVDRFDSIAEAERWIEAGIPVACSVDLSILLGHAADAASGHLIVLVGFTSTGDPICNDPAHKAEIRKTYPRAIFEKAWLSSHRTVYLIYPSSVKAPE